MSKKPRAEVEGLRTWWRGRKPVSLHPRQAPRPPLTSARGWRIGSAVLSHRSFALWAHETRSSPYIYVIFRVLSLHAFKADGSYLYLPREILSSCTSEKLHWFLQTLPVHSSWSFSPILGIQESLNNWKKSIVIFHCNIEYTRLNLIGNLILNAGFILCIWLKWISLPYVQQTVLIFNFCPP